MRVCVCVYIDMYMCIFDGWPLALEDTPLLGKLTITVCRCMLRYSYIIFTQHPQSKLVLYTVIMYGQDINYSF